MELYTLRTGQIMTDTYIIVDGAAAVVVDPADEAERIIDFAAQKGAKIEAVLITHSHFDHVGAAAAIKKHGAKVYISRTDYELLRDMDFVWRLPGMDFAVEPFDADVLLNDGDTLDIIGHKFDVIATPGHTPGGVCYILDGKIMFSGDTLFRSGVGRTDLPHGDARTLSSSLKKILALDGDIAVFPGHGPATTIRSERENNPYVDN